MLDYSSITKVKTLMSVQKVNQLLADDWILLDIHYYKSGPLFILGRQFHFTDIDEAIAQEVKQS